MSITSFPEFGEVDTCAERKFETLLEEVTTWLGLDLKYCRSRNPASISPVERFIICQAKLIRAQVASFLQLAGATSVEWNSGALNVVWPGATPWRVVVSELDLVPSNGDATAFATLVDEVAGHYVVVLPLRLFKHIGQDDVRRAADIERRNKLAKRRGGGEFTADDAFVEGLRIRILRVLQRALSDSPTARLLKSMGLPIVPATDDELLSDGPSLGQDEEHFLAALEADLNGHWQAAAK